MNAADPVDPADPTAVHNAFSQPSRQSPLAVVVLMGKIIRQISIVNIIFISVALFSGRLPISGLALVAVILLLLIGAGVLSWWRFVFVIESGELRVERGVLAQGAVGHTAQPGPDREFRTGAVAPGVGSDQGLGRHRRVERRGVRVRRPRPPSSRTTPAGCRPVSGRVGLCCLRPRRRFIGCHSRSVAIWPATGRSAASGFAVGNAGPGIYRSTSCHPRRPSRSWSPPAASPILSRSASAAGPGRAWWSSSRCWRCSTSCRRPLASVCSTI